MVLTNAEKVKRNYDKDRENILAKKRAAYAAKKLKNIVVEEPPLESTSELIEIQPAKGTSEEPELESKTELVKIHYIFVPLAQITHMINGLENESPGNKKFRINNFKTIINILKPTDYNELLFKLTKQPNKVLKSIKNFEYKPRHTYSVNTQISLFKAILFFLDKFNINIKPDKKTKYEDAIQIGDVISTQELQVKNNSVSIPSFEEYLQKCVEHFGEKSREYLIAKIYHEVSCRNDLNLVLLSDAVRLNREKNYIIVNEFPKATIIINDYKTVDRYGKFNQELSEDLTKLIKEYILTHHIENGDIFFNMNNISMVVSRMNKTLGYEGFGAINLFRKMISSDAKDLSLKEQLKVSKKLKHSLKVHNSNYIIRESIN